MDYPNRIAVNIKILVIAADERYLPTDNGNCSRPVTIRLKRCCRCIISMLQVSEFEVATISGLMTKFEYWAMPHKDEK